jgi:hypothetical protein
MLRFAATRGFWKNRVWMPPFGQRGTAEAVPFPIPFTSWCSLGRALDRSGEPLRHPKASRGKTFPALEAPGYFPLPLRGGAEARLVSSADYGTAEAVPVPISFTSRCSFGESS